MALLLAERDPAYEGVASKFWEHFIQIADSMNSARDPKRSLWDEKDGFFYDHFISASARDDPDPRADHGGIRPHVRRVDGRGRRARALSQLFRRRRWFIEHRPDLIESVGPMVTPGVDGRLILGLVRPEQLKRMLAYMLDEREFLSPYGIRSVSRFHKDHPLILNLEGQEYRARLRAGRIADGALRRKLQLARTDLVPGEPPDPPGAEGIPLIFRRRLPGGVPHRLGKAHEPG